MFHIYTKSDCAQCVLAKNFFSLHGLEFQEHDIELDDQARQFVVERGHRSVPQIYYGDQIFVNGGWQELSKFDLNQIQTRRKLLDSNLGNL